MIRLIEGDFDVVARSLRPVSFQLILTDPPYPRQMALPCYTYLAKHCPVLLDDGGSLITIAPHYLLEEVMDMLKGSLKYRWIYNMDQRDGPHARMAMGVEVCWKPVLHYVQRAYPQGRGFIKDMVSIPIPEKGYDPWQQSLEWAKFYIEKFTQPGDTVLDPFVGTGTVLLACQELGRDGIGIDNNPQMIATAKQRLGL